MSFVYILQGILNVITILGQSSLPVVVSQPSSQTKGK